MSNVNYKNINGYAVWDSKHHPERCPKYRYECMRNHVIAEEMKQILLQIARKKGITVHKIVVLIRPCAHVRFCAAEPANIYNAAISE